LEACTRTATGKAEVNCHARRRRRRIIESVGVESPGSAWGVETAGIGTAAADVAKPVDKPSRLLSAGSGIVRASASERTIYWVSRWARRLNLARKAAYCQGVRTTCSSGIIFIDD